MFPRDLLLVAADEAALADDRLAPDVDPLGPVRPREDEAGDRIGCAAELESVHPPDREVGPLAG